MGRDLKKRSSVLKNDSKSIGLSEKFQRGPGQEYGLQSVTRARASGSF